MWAVTLCCLLPALEAGAVARINGTGTLYAIIQNAVNAAHDGDVVRVATGSYVGQIVHGWSTNRITLMGGYDTNCTGYIGGGLTGLRSPSGPAMYVANAVLTIDGLDLAHSDGGISAADHSTVFFINCRIHDNTRQDGAGIHVDSSLVTLDHTAVYHNDAATNGGGVALINGARLEVLGTGSDIMSNTAWRGAGVYANRSFLFVRDDADVYGNNAVENGGGVYCENSSTVIVAGAYSCIGIAPAGGNKGFDGGGVYALDSLVMVTNGGSIAYNTVVDDGAGAYVTNSVLIIETDGSIGSSVPQYGNYTFGQGGGVYLADSALHMRSGGVVRNNRASMGGGVFALRSHMSITDGATIGASSTNLGNRSIRQGAGISAEMTRITLSNAVIAGNVAVMEGGGIYAVLGVVLDATNAVMRGNYSETSGGALYATASATASLAQVVVSNNHAALDGGGVHWVSSGSLVVQGASMISHNTADADGGGVCIGHGDVRFRDTIVDYNTADADLAGGGNGGGFHIAYGSRLHLLAGERTVSVSGNKATLGGGVYASGEDTLFEMVNGYEKPSPLNNNSAVSGGGIYATALAGVRVLGSVQIAGCDATSGGGCYGAEGSCLAFAGTNGYAPSFAGNRAAYRGGACYVTGDDTLLELRDVSIGAPHNGNTCGGSYDGGGGGIAAWNDATVTAINTRFEYNISTGPGGALHANDARVYIASEYAQPAAGPLPACVFMANASTNAPVWDVGRGGAVYANNMADVTLVNAAFISNLSYYGGALCAQDGADCLAVNGVMAANTAQGRGGALMNISSSTRLLHCTVADNRWQGIDATGSLAAVVLTNCIVWANTNIQIASAQSVHCSDVQGGYAGTRNFSADPVFADRAALDYQLLESSPCVDTGVFVFVLRDCLGVLRTFGDGADIGAYEYVPEPAAVLALGCVALLIRRRK
ncbi:hypothetical protein GX586_09745 [bacterium]|nr:hypothetical protein [bacterium]